MELIETFLIIGPVFVSGLTFIYILRLMGPERWTYPLDLGLKYHEKRIFGKNKTIKGPIIMGFFTGLYGWLFLILLGIDSNWISFLKYATVGLVYSVGELPNSFIKRRLGVPPGKTSPKSNLRIPLLLLDNFDSLVACGVAYYFLFKYSLNTLVVAVLVGGIFHLFTDKLMISLKIKDKH